MYFLRRNSRWEQLPSNCWEQSGSIKSVAYFPVLWSKIKTFVWAVQHTLTHISGHETYTTDTQPQTNTHPGTHTHTPTHTVSWYYVWLPCGLIARFRLCWQSSVLINILYACTNFKCQPAHTHTHTYIHFHIHIAHTCKSAPGSEKSMLATV